MNPDPDTPLEHARHYATVARAIAYLREHARSQPSLAETAAAVHLSPDHLQRVFLAWAGVSPKRFVQYLTKEHALARLRADEPVLGTAHAVGLSGPGRLHDLLLNWEAMTPGEVRAQGAGTTVTHGWGATPFGAALVGWTPRGVCHLAFALGDPAAQEAELRALWPRARHAEDNAGAQALLAQVFTPRPGQAPVRLLLRGTGFQLQVWQALLRLPPGHVVSYQSLARAAGRPGASRAVGSAMAANTVGYLIPCHRVLRSSGDSGEYRWGPERKLALLGWETARREAGTPDRLTP